VWIVKAVLAELAFAAWIGLPAAGCVVLGWWDRRKVRGRHRAGDSGGGPRGNGGTLI
jgi:hypothetical protein